MTRLTRRAIPMWWVMVAAQAAMASRRHWQLLTPRERERMREIVVKSKGRPWTLSERDRRELTKLVGKLRLGRLGRDVAGMASGARQRGRG